MLYAITPEFEDYFDLLQIIKSVRKHDISHLLLRNKNLAFTDILKYRALAIEHLPSSVKVVMNPHELPFRYRKYNTHLHLNSRNLFKVPKSSSWVSASCHNLKEIKAANELNLEFILLSPVLKTIKYPNHLGWKSFSLLAKESKHPVIALGGLNLNSLEEALQSGARGIAGISMFLS